MAKTTVLLDDYDGKVLPDDTKEILLSLGRTTYELHLSEENHGKLLEALHPFIDGADKRDTTVAKAAPAAKVAVTTDDPYSHLDRKAVRTWAQATGFKFTGADGEERTLGDRGRIPNEVLEAYEKAH